MHLPFKVGAIAVAYLEVEPGEILACRPVLQVQGVRIIQRYYDPRGRETHRGRSADTNFALQLKCATVLFDEGLGQW